MTAPSQRGFSSRLIGDVIVDLGFASRAAVDAAVAAGDHAALQRPAHSLKSNAMSVGATRLAELSRSLEMEARSGSVPGADDRVAAVREELGIVRDAVASVRQEAADGG